MGWIERCYQTYENNLGQVGKPSASIRRGWDAPVLLPVAHTTQKVHIEVNLTSKGDFSSAGTVPADDMTTVIPCTEESSARTSGLTPHPLVDKLQYIAGDYKEWGGPKKLMWPDYLELLRAWCESPYGIDSVRAVLAYIEKGSLITDLVRYGVLIADESGYLQKKWTGPKEEMPSIFRLVTGGDQFEAFVRFRVDQDLLSTDPVVWDSYTNYYISTLGTRGVCYVQGKEMPVSLLSPYKIRNPGDRAKLISSNDSTNFTYRGRFESAEEALSIGYETTQKAHSALRWLIGRQGIQNGGQTILVWGIENEPVPDVSGDSLDIVTEQDRDLLNELLAGTNLAEPSREETREAFAEAFNLAIQGYRHKLTEHSKITVMVLDAATQGRLSIRYYRELSGSRLIKNIESWHRTFAWELRYRKVETEENGKQKSIPVVFWGAPAPADIAMAAYGSRVDDKLKQQTIERLLPCITEGRAFPRDLMVSVVHRASNGIAVEPWEAAKTKSIACAIVRGYYLRNKKEEYSMALDETCTNRDYLFGRILACADQVERYAMYVSKEQIRRPTNAMRLEVAFTQHPAKTTALLRKQLLPYVERLTKAGRSTYANDQMLKLIDRIPLDQFNDKTPLGELYLLGYASQMEAFYNSKVDHASEDAEE